MVVTILRAALSVTVRILTRILHDVFAELHTRQNVKDYIAINVMLGK